MDKLDLLFVIGVFIFFFAIYNTMHYFLGAMPLPLFISSCSLMAGFLGKWWRTYREKKTDD
jgi:hypothetical protein